MSSVAFSADSTLVATGSWSYQANVCVWDAETGKQLYKFGRFTILLLSSRLKPSLHAQFTICFFISLFIFFGGMEGVATE